ncbi:hypothetical protein [Wenxinia marina]|uniref:Uncharacterized protein n=1 Tax=Wenxinia marina DSM 24838 TaxID=1123501 RepID=A0A0D0QJC3_9RHOB|nr:hypothetical protein [Wenxinia marina]KIQ71128.1 hypothetical protein Wenmar_00507 [Wenxinia marina DSM 24838]GGL54628.1 hypothetical protein GCM10011392_06300 [Wenxinia marina]
MQLSVSFENTRGTEAGTGPVTVGWFLADAKAAVIYYPPERVRSADLNRQHAKSASRCPAVINLESRYFLIRCPFDINIGFVRDDKGKAAMRNLSGEASAIRGSKLGEKLHMVSEAEWRHKDVPTIQLALPYVFVADEPVYMSQVSPFMHYTRDPLPGTIFGGRFPINVWPRPLMWAFEWWDTTKPIRINRGDPLFYAGFETMPQDRGVAVHETEVTDELKTYLEHISGAVNYVNQTFSLFEAAERVRPETLVVPVRRRRPADG